LTDATVSQGLHSQLPEKHCHVNVCPAYTVRKKSWEHFGEKIVYFSKKNNQNILILEHSEKIQIFFSKISHDFSQCMHRNIVTLKTLP